MAAIFAELALAMRAKPARPHRARSPRPWHVGVPAKAQSLERVLEAALVLQSATASGFIAVECDARPIARALHSALL